MDFDLLRNKFENGRLDTNVLLGSAKLLDTSSRETPAFTDPKYFPFYYYLGTQIDSPTRIVQIGAKLGLIGACFLQGCPTAKEWVSMDKLGSHVLAQTITSNLKRYAGHDCITGCFGLMDDSLMKGTHEWPIDVALLSEEYASDKGTLYLEFFWKYLKPEGLLVVDYIEHDAVRDSFKDFARVKNREPEIFNTRYGVGILTR